jgi:hypothetical protein
VATERSNAMLRGVEEIGRGENAVGWFWGHGVAHWVSHLCFLDGSVTVSST